MRVYTFITENCIKGIHTNKDFRRMSANKQVDVEQRKSGRKIRTEGTCNKLLNTLSLLKETCVAEILISFSFMVIFKYKIHSITSELSRTGRFS